MPSVTYALAAVTGIIGEVRVTDGATVKAGDVILVQHVTKTETHISSPAAGKIKVLVEKGAQVNQGDRIAEVSS